MKPIKMYKRYKLTQRINQKRQKIDLMGCYKFLGEWGENLRRQYERHIKLYNKCRFWWQPELHM